MALYLHWQIQQGPFPILKDVILVSAISCATNANKETNWNMKSSLFLACVILLPTFCTAIWQNFEHLNSKTPIEEQEQAVRGLISRLLPERASQFTVVVDPTLSEQDAFTLQTVGNKLVLTGTTGVATGWAFHHYLKYFCKVHISWSGNQLDTIPTPLPAITQKLKIVVPHR